MALLEEGERSELPSMSWNSVVRAPATPPPPPAPEPEPAPAEPAPSNESGPSTTLTADDAPPVAFSFKTEAIAPTNVAASPPVPPPPAPPAVAAASTDQASPPAASPSPPSPPPAFTLPSIDLGATESHGVHIEPDEAAPLGMTKPTFTLPAIPATGATPESAATEPTATEPTATESAASEPQAVEPQVAESSAADPGIERRSADSNAGTPEIALPTDQAPRSIATTDTNEQPVVASAPPVESTPAAAAAPSLAPAISLPNRAAVQAAPSPLVAEPPPARRQPRRRKDRSGGVARAVFFLLVVAALVSAGVIFGRPYLFSEAWEPNALEFSEPIEAARGAEFVEPVLLIPQATALQRAMVTEHLLGDPAASIPMWRALGLAGPDSTDTDTLETLISDQAHVLYSPVDGQVYYDQSYVRNDRSALITQAMAAAALDQDFGFSMGAEVRSLDDAALTQAHVNQQARIIQLNAANGVSVTDPDMAALAFLPAVLDYRITAPTVFTELLAPVNDIAPNPLASLAPGAGPGPLQIDSLDQIPSTSDVVGDLPVGPAIVTDRAFWYLSFASHVDPATAYEMSNSIHRAGLQMVQNDDRMCAVSTFTTLTAGTAEALRANLDAWAATAVSLEATVTSLPDMSIRVRSCDPGAGFVSFANFGVARQLMAWRATELAVTNLVTAQGGSGADLVAAFDLIPTTPSVLALTKLPAGTAPSELAGAAAVAAIDVVALASVSEASAEG